MRPFTCKYKHTHTHTTHTHTYAHTYTQRMFDITKCKVSHLSPWKLCEVVQYIHHTCPVHQYNTGTSPVHSSHTCVSSVGLLQSIVYGLWSVCPHSWSFRISNTGIPKAKKFRALNNNQLVVKWCLGLQLDTSRGTSCALCPDVALDPLDHHAATCWHGGDIVVCHHKLRDVYLNYCHIAELEAGRCLTRGLT